jgi:DNA polymerase I
VGLGQFNEIWAVDFEFQQPLGERPNPLCMVARECHSGQLMRIWRDKFPPNPPFAIGSDALFVAYNASAELGCFLALGWDFPLRILDPYVEFRGLRSGLSRPASGFGLLGCLSFFGLDTIPATEKAEMRDLVMRGGPYTDAERLAVLDYCQSDVDALVMLLPKMTPLLSLPHALCRGRYMGAVARIQWEGVPIDLESLGRLRDGWEVLQDRLIQQVNSRYGVFEGRSFKVDRFAGWLVQHEIAWPRLGTGALDFRSDTFAEMSIRHPEVSMLHQLRVNLSQLRLHELEVGVDGRNRPSLFPFGSKTGRNQPSNSRFIFGPAVWLRGLIRPSDGRAVAYVDWSQQEFGIAAALSDDHIMQDAYASGDPYLSFGKQAGVIPLDGTKTTHKREREQFKACVLGVQYGMGEESLSLRIGRPVAYARDLLRLHRETYPVFWGWSDRVQDHAMLRGNLSTVWGWRVHVGAESNPRSLRNFPMQANGSEMLRLACCLATERGINVCAPVHDAILIESAATEIADAVAECQKAMREASEAVLGGFSLRTDADIVTYPHRYADERGKEMWELVWNLI